MASRRTNLFVNLSGTGATRLVLVQAGTAIYTSTGTTTYGDTTVQETSGSPDLSDLRVGMRIWSIDTAPDPDVICWGRISAIDDGTDTITLTEDWWPQNPTNNQVFTIDGWVMDLGVPKEITQTFTPHQLIHNLYRGRVENKFFGWKYGAVLDYSDHVFDDILVEMLPATHFIKDTDTLHLYPHKDKSSISYPVIFNGPTSFTPFGYTSGHKKVSFSFSGTDLESAWPIPTVGYGFDYGNNYGFQL
jgi:hypothetical protein